MFKDAASTTNDMVHSLVFSIILIFSTGAVAAMAEEDVHDEKNCHVTFTG
jgi:hypothetical protein